VIRALARSEESSMKKLALAVAVAALVSACGQPETEVAADEPDAIEFANDNERIIYALGVVLAENMSDSIAELSLTEEEFAIAAAGMTDVIGGTEPRVEMEIYGPQIQLFANERLQSGLANERAASAAFADEIAAEPGAERMPSGIVFTSITEGEGANPTAADTVTVHYHGTLRDGSVFDSSIERDTPATFPLSGVIPCWTEGVQKIKVGGKAKLLCPSDTAYGDGGRPGIPGGAALLFEVELLSID
jgi:FKBP-type peptidyl-prolyl cis-trans isomerase FkpA